MQQEKRAGRPCGYRMSEASRLKIKEAAAERRRLLVQAKMVQEAINKAKKEEVGRAALGAAE